jgi:hypothetical protein
VIGATDNLGENLYSFDVDGESARALTTYHGLATSGGRWGEYPDYSPDGARILFARGNGANVDIAMIDSAGGRDRVVVPGSVNDAYIPHWLDGDHFVLLRHGYVALVDTTGVARDSLKVADSMAVEQRPFLANAAERTAYFWAPGSRMIVAADFRSHTLRVVARTPEPMYPAGWNAAGQLIVASVHIPKLYRVDRTTGGLTLIGAMPRGCIGAVVDRRGTQVVCRMGRGTGDVWLAAPATQ